MYRDKIISHEESHNFIVLRSRRISFNFKNGYSNLLEKSIKKLQKRKKEEEKWIRIPILIVLEVANTKSKDPSVYVVQLTTKFHLQSNLSSRI